MNSTSFDEINNATKEHKPLGCSSFVWTALQLAARVFGPRLKTNPNPPQVTRRLGQEDRDA